MGAGGVDAFVDLEAVRVELKRRDVAELVPVGIVKLVIVNFAVFRLCSVLFIALAKNPFPVWTRICLWWFSFDLVLQGFHPFVRVGKIVLVQQKESAGQGQGDEQNGNKGAIDADTGGLHG